MLLKVGCGVGASAIAAFEVKCIDTDFLLLSDRLFRCLGGRARYSALDPS